MVICFHRNIARWDPELCNRQLFNLVSRASGADSLMKL